MKLFHGEVTDCILGSCYRVHRELGGGFAERVYQRSMARELEASRPLVESQVDIGVRFRGHTIACFRADPLVNRRVLVEIKARPALNSAHTAQLLNYLRASDIEVGLLLNFGARPEFQRLLFTNDRKKGHGGHGRATETTEGARPKSNTEGHGDCHGGPLDKVCEDTE